MMRAVSALETFRDLGEKFGEVDMMALLAFAHQHRGDRAGAVSLVTSALPLAESLDYDLGQGRLWYLRAVIAREQGRRADAASFAERCLGLAEQLRFGEPVTQARIERSLSVFRGQAVLYGQVVGLRVIGELALADGRAAEAICTFAGVLPLTGRLGNTYERALVFKGLGSAHLSEGDRRRARQAWHQARELFGRLQNHPEVAAADRLLTTVPE
jgi:tetratricopeptide (TPR) repeat protein